MNEIAAVVAAVLLAALAAFQLALAAGAPWGRAAYGGQHAGVLPVGLRVTSAVAGLVIHPAIALVLLRAAGWSVRAPVPDGWLTPASWAVAGFFLIGVVLNGISRSRVERAIWTPVTAVLLGAAGVVALG